jgi:hypothetical protein
MARTKLGRHRKGSGAAGAHVLREMLIGPSPPPAVATPAPISLQLQTDKQTYRTNEQVGLRVIITNLAPFHVSPSIIALDAPEWESEVFLTRPDGSRQTCIRPENGELLSISAMYPNIDPRKQLIEPRTGYRPLRKWGCALEAPGSYSLKLRQFFVDFYTAGHYYLDTPPIEVRVIEPEPSKSA